LTTYLSSLHPLLLFVSSFLLQPYSSFDLQHIEPLTSTPLVRLRGSREPLHDSRIRNCGNDNRSHCQQLPQSYTPELEIFLLQCPTTRGESIYSSLTSQRMQSSIEPFRSTATRIKAHPSLPHFLSLHAHWGTQKAF
jgi:hypothetical protein